MGGMALFISLKILWVLQLRSSACVLSRFSRVRLCATLWTVPTRLLCHWDSPGKITGVACHALLQGNLSYPRIEPSSPMSSTLAGGFFTTSAKLSLWDPSFVHSVTHSYPECFLNMYFSARVPRYLGTTL